MADHCLYSIIATMYSFSPNFCFPQYEYEIIFKGVNKYINNHSGTYPRPFIQLMIYTVVFCRY